MNWKSHFRIGWAGRRAVKNVFRKLADESVPSKRERQGFGDCRLAAIIRSNERGELLQIEYAALGSPKAANFELADKHRKRREIIRLA